MAQRGLDNFAVRVGVENELLTLNDRGFIIPAAAAVVNEIIREIVKGNTDVSMLRELVYGIQWEPHPAQLEIVTQPLCYLDVDRAVRLARQYVAMAAMKRSIKIFAGSIHPVQSDPFPINGTHISLSLIHI